jgi:hypothetical protein
MRTMSDGSTDIKANVWETGAASQFICTWDFATQPIFESTVCRDEEDSFQAIQSSSLLGPALLDGSEDQTPQSGPGFSELPEPWGYEPPVESDASGVTHACNDAVSEGSPESADHSCETESSMGVAFDFAPGPGYAGGEPAIQSEAMSFENQPDSSVAIQDTNGAGNGLFSELPDDLEIKQDAIATAAGESEDSTIAADFQEARPVPVTDPTTLEILETVRPFESECFGSKVTGANDSLATLEQATPTPADCDEELPRHEEERGLLQDPPELPGQRECPSRESQERLPPMYLRPVERYSAWPA